VKHILDQERELLSVLNWSVHYTSPVAWIQTFCKRMDIITGKDFATSLSWIFQQSMASAHALAMHSAMSSELPPKRTANGLLCLFLVVARMVPLSHMRPILETTNSEWETLFLESGLATTGLPVCELPLGRLPGVLQSLLTATGTSAKELQEDALAVARLMSRVASAGRENAQRQHTAQQAVQVQQQAEIDQQSSEQQQWKRPERQSDLSFQQPAPGRWQSKRKPRALR